MIVAFCLFPISQNLIKGLQIQVLFLCFVTSCYFLDYIVYFNVISENSIFNVGIPNFKQVFVLLSIFKNGHLFFKSTLCPLEQGPSGLKQLISSSSFSLPSIAWALFWMKKPQYLLKGLFKQLNPVSNQSSWDRFHVTRVFDLMKSIRTLEHPTLEFPIHGNIGR